MAVALIHADDKKQNSETTIDSSPFDIRKQKPVMLIASSHEKKKQNPDRLPRSCQETQLISGIE
jgi:hypothetical protein